MSLKAYDGMMTRKGFEYIHDNIIAKIDEFRAIGEKYLSESYADCVVEFFDNNYSVIENLKFNTIHEKELEKDIDRIPENWPLVRVLQQGGIVLSGAKYVNPYFTQLSLNIEKKDDKLLIYPNYGSVYGYKELLLTFLTDWYAQNQVDPPSDVSEKEWKERCADWWGYGDTQIVRITITVFESLGYGFKSLNRTFKDEQMIKGILDCLPSEEDRIFKKAQRQMISLKMKSEKNKDDRTSQFMKWADYFKTDEGVEEINSFIKTEKVTVTKITEKLLTTEYSELLKKYYKKPLKLK